MAKKTTENKEIKNKVKVSDAGPCKKKVEIEIPQEKIDQLKKSDYAELRKESVVPGFRKGKAPMRLLEKRFGKEIAEQVKVKLIAQATEEALEDKKLDALNSDPNIDIEAVELPDTGSMKFEFEVEVRPQFDLPELKGIKVEKVKAEITDDQIDQEVMELRKNAGLWQPVENAAAEVGDQVVADVKVTIEDDSDTEPKTEGATIIVRENGLVAGVPVQNLDKLMTGVKSGDVKTTTVDVPKTFYNEQYREKKVTLEITVEDIKKLQPAELNDEFFTRFGVKDLTELKESIKKHAKDMIENQVKQAMAQDVRNYLIDNTSFDLPADVVADQSQRLLQRQYMTLMMQGADREKIAEQMEQLRTSSESQAVEQLKYFFIMDKIAETLKVEVSDAEINNYIAQMALQRGRRPEKMREDMIKDGSLAQFTMQVREEKCIEKLLEDAKVTEVDAKKKSPAKKATKKVAKKATKKTTKQTSSKTDKAVDKKPASKAKAVKKTTKKATKKKDD